MGRTVLLRHELPDGSAHFDWLIQRQDGGPLATFRVGERIDRAEVREFGAERLVDHRAEYLEYQGPISGGRGTVRRVAEGTLQIELDSEGAFICQGGLGGRTARFTGSGRGVAWQFRAENGP